VTHQPAHSQKSESLTNDLSVTLQWASAPEQCVLWRNIASAAESGWDFSSRWLADGRSLNTIRTTQVGLLNDRRALHYNGMLAECT